MRQEIIKLKLALSLLKKGIQVTDHTDCEKKYKEYEKIIEELKITIEKLQNTGITDKTPHHKIIKKLQKEVNKLTESCV